MDHRASEAVLEQEIASLNEILIEVQQTLSGRIKMYGEINVDPTAPIMIPDDSSPPDYTTTMSSSAPTPTALYPTPSPRLRHLDSPDTTGDISPRLRRVDPDSNYRPERRREASSSDTEETAEYYSGHEMEGI